MWSVLGKIPRLQPYFLAKNASFSSLFNLQSKSINFKFGHFWAKYHGYSLTVWPKMPHFHHFSICNQIQSISNLVSFGQNTKDIALLFGHKCLIFVTFQSAIKIHQFQIWSFLAKYQGNSLTFWPQLPHFHHFSICNQNQSISNLVIFGQNTKAIALLFGQKCLIFITFQSAIKINQFQIWSFVRKIPRAIALLFGQKCLIFITFQSAIKINQFQIWSFLGKIPRLQPYVLAKNASFSSLFNLQSKSINFKLGHFWAKYQGYSLTVWPKMRDVHHFSICNQNQLSTYLVIFGQNTKAIALLFGQKCLIFITFQSAIKIHQFQIWSFLGKIPRQQPHVLATTASFSSLFNLQSKSINFKFGHFWAKYQGYSLTFWPKMPHFHHFSICNQNQSVSNLVIFGKNTKAIALLFGQECLIFITFQSAIKINQFQIWSFVGKIPRLQPYCLAKNASCSSLSNLQSKSIKYIFGKFWANYQGYSLTFWPKMPHFHHFSICNQNQSILKCGQFWEKYQGYSLTFWPKMPHFHHFSICNQNQSISNLVIFGQTTKATALLFGQKCLIFITFQSEININQFQIGSFLGKIPRLQPYFLAKNASFSSLFNLQSKSIKYIFGHFWAKYQGYSLTFWPKMPHFHHFSICNQNQSISKLVSFGQNTKAIALLLGQTCLIFITFQSAIKINQFQIWSVVGKIPRLQPYCLAKSASFSSLFNLQSN